MNYQSPDLTQHPPRSPRARLGGYVILPRLLDKCRAEIAGRNGEYHYACPIDQRFLEFAGIDPQALKAEAAKGRSDAELLEWIRTNQSKKREPWEIAQWSAQCERSGPSDNESREFVSEQVKAAGGETRDDIGTWFDYLDLDDFATFGGRP
jgi:Domain of unknown function (DUF5069)